MKRQRTVLCTLIAALGLGLVMAQDQKPSKPLPDTQGASPAPAPTGDGDDDGLLDSPMGRREVHVSLSCLDRMERHR
jgi:hypothetical protein